MINVKDVITLRVPYPDVTSELAKKSHMYICIETSSPLCRLVKCQSFKPYHSLKNSLPVNRLTEQPNISRNPFQHPTVIDLDKLFSATHALLPESLKAPRGISDAVLTAIKENIPEAVKIVNLSDSELKSINSVIR